MKRLVFVTLLFITFQCSFAQKTIFHNDLNEEYRTAIDLFGKEKFGAAKKKFTNVIKLDKNSKSEMSANAAFYAGICAVKLFNNDAERLLTDFIEENPEHAKVNAAQFYLGSFYYSKKNYSKALKGFQALDIRNLTDVELAEYYFKTGYCYFVKEEYEAASKAFFEIKDVDTKYTIPANYYYGHIAYINNNMETALKSFLKLKDDPHFGSLMPYYIVNIYYKQGRYKELLEQATTLIEKTDSTKVPELARIIGEAYFKTQKYDDAIKYFELHSQKSLTPISRLDKYQLGYCYYKAGNYDKAIIQFNPITTEKDTLSQNIQYLLADCYLQTKQLPFARNAFQSAYKLGFDTVITQSSLLNYAKLSYQLSFNPYNDAVAALMKYIEVYPKAADIDEANNLLVTVFFATKKYKDALNSIDKISFKSTELKSAYQKIAFYRGIELFNNGDFTNAIIHFNKSLEYILHPAEAAQAIYWKGESYYRLNKYDSASQCFNNFLLSQGAFQLPEYNMAHYNLGYTAFKQKKYNESAVSFRKFLASNKEEDKKIINDANIRVGDCYYIVKNYDQAIDFYNKAIAANATDADYAIFQKAICYGVLSQFNPKIETLLDLLKKHPNSSYTVDAKYELANTYLILPDNENALKYFTSIVNEHPTSSYVSVSLLKSGLIYFNTDKYEPALQTLKKVVADYPATKESKEALISISDIYVNMNKPDEFFVYVQNIPFANVTKNEQDSITYIASQNQYMNGDCESSVKGFTDYLEKFPEGIFVTNAQFYRAECLHKQGKLKEALKDYSSVIKKKKTIFTESAMMKSAAINFKLKNYNDALANYITIEDEAEIKANVLEAQIGQMRCYNLTNNYQKAIEASTKLLTLEKIDDNLIQEAHLSIGKAQLALNNTSFAQAEFLAVSKMAENEMKAEAKYNLALIQYNLGNYKESEKIVFEIINQMPSYEYWIAKSFILLADNLVKMDNIFQAKHTLQSIIDNYDGLDLVQIAYEKLNKINEDEKLKLQNNALKQDSLFQIKQDTIFEIKY